MAGVIMCLSFVPYLRDILRGKVRPARSARLMFVVLLTVALLQQKQLGSGLTLALTIGDLIGAVLILFVAIKYGMGGFQRLDIVCYGLLVINIIFWLSTDNALLALHLTVLCDVIAMAPTLVKTWHHPRTETALFYVLGIVGPILAIVAGNDYTYGILLFPLYLALINSLEIALIYRPALVAKFTKI